MLLETLLEPDLPLNLQIRLPLQARLSRLNRQTTYLSPQHQTIHLNSRQILGPQVPR